MSLGTETSENARGKEVEHFSLFTQLYHIAWIQLFSVPVPQVYTIKHLATQAAFANIWERMGHSEKLTELEGATVIGCHCCNIEFVKYLPSETFHYQL